MCESEWPRKRQGWVGPSHSPAFSSNHSNLSSQAFQIVTATNDDCLSSVVSVFSKQALEEKNVIHEEAVQDG